jgi:spermidine synthase
VKSLARTIHPLYLITFIFAFCSIVYELLMAQTLTLLTSDSVLRYSTTIGLYLACMGIGAFLCTKKRLARPEETLLKVELLLSVVGGTAVIILYFFHSIYTYLLQAGQPPSVRSTFFFVASYGIIAVIGVLTGFELPLLIHIREKEQEKTTNIVLGVDYLGSLAGAILFPLLLLPFLDVIKIGFVTAMLNVLAAVMLLRYAEVIGRRLRIFLTAANVAIFSVLIFLLSYSSAITQYCLKKYYYYQESSVNLQMLFSTMKSSPDVEWYRSPYQNIDIVKSPDSEIFSYIFSFYTSKYITEPDYPKDYWLFLNGDYQFFSGCDEVYHEYMVHVPIIANKVPRKVLVLGGGDGLVNRELLKYPGIESITLIELDKKMVDVAMTHPVMRRINKDSFLDPRIKVHIMDAFTFVRTSKEIYDAIYIDFPDPKDYNLSKLYSREFYFFVKNRLADDGFVAMDSPGSLVKGDWVIYYNTIKASGFETIIPFSSTLEEDNPQFDKENKQLHEAVKAAVHDLRQGFIMMRKGGPPVVAPYGEPGISLYLMNEKRYRLSFRFPYSMKAGIDWDRVNSIMRPTFPNYSLMHIRLPY